MIISSFTPDGYAQSIKGRIKSLFKLPLDPVDKFSRIIKSKNLEKYFIITGQRYDIAELAISSNIILFLSKRPEGFGRPLIEAMAAGVPVVATDIGPSREILGKDTALFAHEGDWRNLARNINKLIQSEKTRHMLGENGKKRAELFDIQIACNDISKIYESLIP
tara:strand:- start:6 stop:497 length:492 start_codon:yes stop_codon:yes gene_type:complete